MSLGCELLRCITPFPSWITGVLRNGRTSWSFAAAEEALQSIITKSGPFGTTGLAAPAPRLGESVSDTSCARCVHLIPLESRGSLEGALESSRPYRRTLQSVAKYRSRVSEDTAGGGSRARSQSLFQEQISLG